MHTPRTFLSVVLIATSVACESPGPAAATVTFVPATASLIVGDSVPLSLLVERGGRVLSPAGATFSSSDSSVAIPVGATFVRAVGVGAATIRARVHGAEGAMNVTVAADPVVALVIDAPASLPVHRSAVLTARALNASGVPIAGRTVTWRSSRPEIARVDATGRVIAIVSDSVSVIARTGVLEDTVALAITPGALPNRGLWVQFERRGAASGFYPGELLELWDAPAPGLGHSVATEVGLQVDQMLAMGVNTITLEMRASDAEFTGQWTPPNCNIPPVLGIRWPDPRAIELQNLDRLLDLLQAKGITVWMFLTNTHMEQAPSVNERWLGPILDVMGPHPAVDLIMFHGDQYASDIDNNGSLETCGFPAEPPLWLGTNAIPAQYVRWAIGFAHGRGIAWRRLSAEAVVNDYFTMNRSNLVSPIITLKAIFDALNVPDAERTYAISMYEHSKCSTARTLPCSPDRPPAEWADSTLRHIFTVIGDTTRARVVAAEFGNYTPVSAGWSTTQAFEDLVMRFRRWGVDGGSFWRWTHFTTSEESDATLALPVKTRGVGWTYTAMREVIRAAYQLVP